MRAKANKVGKKKVGVQATASTLLLLLLSACQPAANEPAQSEQENSPQSQSIMTAKQMASDGANTKTSTPALAVPQYFGVATVPDKSTLAVLASLSLTTDKQGNLSACQGQVFAKPAHPRLEPSVLNGYGVELSDLLNQVLTNNETSSAPSASQTATVNQPITSQSTSQLTNRNQVKQIQCSVATRAASAAAVQPVTMDANLLAQLVDAMQGQPRLLVSINRFDLTPHPRPQASQDKTKAISESEEKSNSSDSDSDIDIDTLQGKVSAEDGVLLLLSGGDDQTVRTYYQRIASLLSPQIQVRVLPSVETTQLINERNAKALAAINAARRTQDSASNLNQIEQALNQQVIYFALNRTDIPKINQQILSQAIPMLSELLAHDASTRIQVIGHTDNIGGKASNKVLSQQRADAVKAFLVAQGVSEQRIDAIGRGDTHPIASNDTEAGRFQNRRIEFAISTDTAATTRDIVE